MRALATRVGRRLKAKKRLLVSAESCTGGWVAQVVTSIPGSSAWFERGFVTYSNAAKRELLGVEAATLKKHGAVSEETAREMARGALARSKGNLALAVTGIAGPGGGSRDKPVGTVCFAWCLQEGAEERNAALPGRPRERAPQVRCPRARKGFWKPSREDNGGMSSVRPAAVAGMFYPADPRILAAEVDDLLGGVEQPAPRLGYPKALIVPHAGYVYSGGVAAHAYDELAAARGSVRRVVLLGPTHRVAVRGLAVPSAGVFATPLGSVRIDRAALQAVRDLPQVVTSDAAHAREHSLEVQLPFLQKMLGDFALAPFAVGAASAEEVAAVIERLWGGPETLIVISTDLSHYHPYETARAIDGATLAAHRRVCHRPRSRGGVRRDAAERFAIAGQKTQPVAQAARRLQLRRHRGRQGPGGRLLGVRAVRGERSFLGGSGKDAAVDRARQHREPSRPERAEPARRRHGSSRPAPPSSR